MQSVNSKYNRVEINTPLTEDGYRELGDYCRSQPGIQLWVNHGYPQMFPDLTFLRFFRGLRSFRLTVFDLHNWEGLEYLTDELEFLDLGATRTGRFSLSFLSRLPNLRKLMIEGHTRGIECIAGLANLQDLVLRSVTLPDLSVLTGLYNLEFLDLKLGGTKDLSHLPLIGRLRYLELWSVRGLSDLTPVGELPDLEHLHLESLKQVTHLPVMTRLANLHTVLLQNMRGLTDLTPLRAAPALRNLVCWESRQLKPEHFSCLAGHPTLTGVSLGLGSDRRNVEARSILGIDALVSDTHFARQWH